MYRYSNCSVIKLLVVLARSRAKILLYLGHYYMNDVYNEPAAGEREFEQDIDMNDVYNKPAAGERNFQLSTLVSDLISSIALCNLEKNRQNFLRPYRAEISNQTLLKDLIQNSNPT